MGNLNNSSTLGWNVTGTAETVLYGATNFPKATDPGPSNRGQRFFAGGPSATSTMRQQIDLTQFTSQIHTGTVQLQLSAYLGGYLTDDDTVAVIVHTIRQDSSSQPTFTLTGIGAGFRNHVTGLFHQQADFALVPTAVGIIIDVVFTRSAGVYDDGYADNVSAKLINLNATTPPPAPPAGSSPELLKNGHFDAAAGGTAGPVTVPNWSGGTAVNYGTPNFPAAGGPVPTDHGANFLAGGVTSFVYMSQTVKIPVGYDALIDKGRVIMQLSEYEGGYSFDGDSIGNDVQFINSGGASAGGLLSRGPDSEERASLTGLWYRANTAIVPTGTRQITLRYRCDRTDGLFCDGYVDDASVRLLNVPLLPTIATIAPSTVKRGTPTAITINGTRFKTGAKITVNGTGATITNVVFVSSTKLTAKFTFSSSVATGKRTVTVKNTDGGNAICTNCITLT